ncbi:MAG: hypothetical protein LBI62_02775 [Candidatus Accumulibacter sp.]|nr:hypothetical protein [Accumulibacter sp.]
MDAHVPQRAQVGRVVRDQGSGIRDQGSGIRDQGSGIRDQKKLPAALPPRGCWGSHGFASSPARSAHEFLIPDP